jgi:hypothetical protein
MKQNFSFLKHAVSAFLLYFITSSSFGQVNISGATVGNGNYTTLKNAFSAINSASQTNANIAITIYANSSEGTSTATLNAGTWTSLSISPSGGNRTISGNTTAGNALVYLNGADNVIIDGLNTGGNSLTIANTRVSSTNGTSTIKFFQSAINNVIQNCTIKGSGTATPSAAATTANILFDGGILAGTLGNSDNQILNCDITSNPVTYATQLIGSSGGSSTFVNKNITISGNKLHDYYGTSGMTAINVGTYNDSWTITNNKIYQAINQTGLALGSRSKAIVINATGGNFNVNSNTIGYNSAAGTGMMTNTGGQFVGIEFSSVAASPISNIQGNQINGIKWTCVTGSFNLGSAAILGIYVLDGAVNIGTTTANIIGSSTGVGSATNGIYLKETSNLGAIYGIVLNSSTGCSISNNIIGAIATDGTSNRGYYFYGISIYGSGSHTITNNTIGNSTSGSISLGVVGTSNKRCTATGIVDSSTGNTIIGSLGSGNTIQNININATAANGFIGIENNGAKPIMSINYNTIKRIVFGATAATHNSSLFGISNWSIVGNLNISNNQFGTSIDNLVNFKLTSTAATGEVDCIFNAGGDNTATLNITNNDFRGVVYAFTGGGLISVVRNISTLLSFNMSNNTFTNLNINSSGLTYVLNNSGPISGNFVIDNNTIVTGLVSKEFYGIYDSGFHPTTAMISITNNSLANVTTNNTNVCYGIYSIGGTNGQRIINNNTINNWSISGNGGATVIAANAFNGTSSIANNSINNIVATSSSDGNGSLTALNMGGASTSTNFNISNNTISNLSSSKSTCVGINYTAFSTASSFIHHNTITNLSSGGSNYGCYAMKFSNGASNQNIYENTITGITCSGTTAATYGIEISASATTANYAIYKNNIHSFNNPSATATTNAPIIYGINITDAMNATIYKNKIYDLALTSAVNTNGKVYGIYLDANINGTVTAYNNMISDLRAIHENNTNAINGIFVYSGGTNAKTVKVYNNTVYLNASSDGANFGTSGLYSTAGANGNGQSYFNNNLIINKSIANGTGKTYALFRNGANLSNYDNSSSNNLYYVNSANPTSYIANDGTNDYITLSAFQTAVSPRETNSVSGDPIFLSTLGSSSDFLHIDYSDLPTTTLINGKGTPIAIVTDDIDSAIRQSHPDIGADEGICIGFTTTVSPIGPITICPNGQQTLTVATTAINPIYQWKKDGIDVGTNSNTYLATAVGSYSVAVIDAATYCDGNSNATIINVNSTTWNGSSWSSGVPDSTKGIIFAGNYSIGSNLSACSCTVNSGNVTIASGVTLLLTNNVAVNGGSLTFENNSSLIQTNSAIANTGNIIYKRNTSALNHNYDFVYWGSPVNNQAIGNIWMASNWADTFYSFDTVADNWILESAATIMTPGKGFISRARDGQNGFTVGSTWLAQFSGVPNNGNISFTVAKSGLNDSNFIANPYPSALDLESFYEDNNTKISANFYIWTHYTSITNNVYADDYATYNAILGAGVGTGAPASTGGIAPNQYLAAAQGFSVEAINNGATITFKNNHRVAGNNNQFFKMSTKSAKTNFPPTPPGIESHKIWLNISNDIGVFKQQLIAYAQGASNGFDTNYDAKTFDGNENIDFYSIIPDNNLTIQSRTLPFTTQDEVTLGYKTANAGVFQISIDHFDQFFTTQDVYLFDKVQNVMYNLKNGAYTFNTSIGTFDNRFAIKYTTTLGIGDFNTPENKIAVVNENNQIHISSSTEIIDKVEIFDLLGKMIFQKSKVNSNKLSIPYIVANQQFLLVKTLLQNGQTVNNKIIY